MIRFRRNAGTSAEGDTPINIGSAQPVKHDDGIQKEDKSQQPTTDNNIDDEKRSNSTNQPPSIARAVQQFWDEHVALDIPTSAFREHISTYVLLLHPGAIITHMRLNRYFAFYLDNERAFLAWLGLSMGLSTMGVLITQVSRIQHAVHPAASSHPLRFFILGKPQAVACQAMAILTVLVGCYRFFKQQAALTRKEILINGFDLFVVVGLISLVSLCMEKDNRSGHNVGGSGGQRADNK